MTKLSSNGILFHFLCRKREPHDFWIQKVAQLVCHNDEQVTSRYFQVHSPSEFILTVFSKRNITLCKQRFM